MEKNRENKRIQYEKGYYRKHPYRENFFAGSVGGR